MESATSGYEQVREEYSSWITGLSPSGACSPTVFISGKACSSIYDRYTLTTATGGSFSWSCDEEILFSSHQTSPTDGYHPDITASTPTCSSLHFRRKVEPCSSIQKPHQKQPKPEMTFINMTAADVVKLLSGVAPSGRSSTRTKRRSNEGRAGKRVSQGNKEGSGLAKEVGHRQSANVF